MSITIHDKKNKAHEKMKRNRPAQAWLKEEYTPLKKPDWIKIRLTHSDKASELKEQLREHRLVTVCEEASCPNLSECFSKGTASFMILGDKCTRRCSFCDVAHGRPSAIDPEEPANLAKMIENLKLRYVVITSVDRDDLEDGGAEHFANCIKEIRQRKDVLIEILVPDFRGRQELALEKLSLALPDVLNHNIETVPELYAQARPGSDYKESLELIQKFKQAHPHIPTKSGLMLGLGETDSQVLKVLEDLREHGCNWVTLGQYLQPSKYHIPVSRYVSPEQFDVFKEYALKLGFDEVASGPFVRSSYHADELAKNTDFS